MYLGTATALVVLMFARWLRTKYYLHKLRKLCAVHTDLEDKQLFTGRFDYRPVNRAITLLVKQGLLLRRRDCPGIILTHHGKIELVTGYREWHEELMKQPTPAPAPATVAKYLV